MKSGPRTSPFYDLVAKARVVTDELQQLDAKGIFNMQGVIEPATDENMTLIHDVASRAGEAFEAILQHINEHALQDPQFKTVDARTAFEMGRLRETAPEVVAFARGVTAKLERQRPQCFRSADQHILN